MRGQSSRLSSGLQADYDIASLSYPFMYETASLGKSFYIGIHQGLILEVRSTGVNLFNSLHAGVNKGPLGWGVWH